MNNHNRTVQFDHVPFILLMALFMFCLPIPSSADNTVEPDTFDLKIQLVDQRGEPIPQEEIQDAIRSVYLKAEFAFYTEGRFRTSLDVPIRGFKDGYFLFQESLPLQQLKKMGVDPEEIDRYGLKLSLPHHRKFPYSGDVKIVMPPDKNGPQIIQLPLKHKPATKYKAVDFKLVSAVTGSPLSGYKLRTPDKKTVQTGQDGLVTVNVPAPLGKPAYLGAAVSQEGNAEKFSSYRITQSDIDRYAQTGEPVVVLTQKPLATFTVKEQVTATTNSAIDGISGYVRVTLYREQDNTYPVNCPVADGQFVIYAMDNELFDGDQPIKAGVEITDGDLMQYRIARGSEFEILPKSPDVQSHDLMVERNTPENLTVSLTDQSDGSVIRGARVDIFGKPDAIRPLLSAQTNALGVAKFKSTLPDKYWLKITSDGYLQAGYVHNFKKSVSAEYTLQKIINCTLAPSPEVLDSTRAFIFVCASRDLYREFVGKVDPVTKQVGFESIPNQPGFLVLFDRDKQVSLIQRMDPKSPPKRLSLSKRQVFSFSISMRYKDEDVDLPVYVVHAKTGLPIHISKGHTIEAQDMKLKLFDGEYDIYARFPAGLIKVDSISTNGVQTRKQYKYQIPMPDPDDLLKLDDLRRPPKDSN